MVEKVRGGFQFHIYPFCFGEASWTEPVHWGSCCSRWGDALCKSRSAHCEPHPSGPAGETFKWSRNINTCSFQNTNSFTGSSASTPQLTTRLDQGKVLLKVQHQAQISDRSLLSVTLVSVLKEQHADKNMWHSFDQYRCFLCFVCPSICHWRLKRQTPIQVLRVFGLSRPIEGRREEGLYLMRSIVMRAVMRAVIVWWSKCMVKYL